MSKNYVAYHVHSDDSVLDSCTDFKQYVDKAVKLGQKAIAFTEHGKPMGWVRKKLYCDEKGIKFIRGVECYLTENIDGELVRDNYHTILLAKNDAGWAELLELINVSTRQDHIYYDNRITFKEFLNISSNIIKISACVASPLNKLPITHPLYDKLVQHYDYLEVQPHNTPEQIEYNRHLVFLSERFNKPLIAATDAHSVDPYMAECREILLRGKDRWYEDGDMYDLTYKSYEQLVDAFRQQDALPETLYLKAIENTNIMADSIDDFVLDTSIKYPVLYGSPEHDTEKFRDTVYRKFQEKLESGIIPAEQREEFEKDLAEELRVFEKVGMSGFMLSMAEILNWCREQNIPTGTARGSVGGSKAAYVTDIIDLNPATWKTVFSRFCNEDRKEIGDIDIDVIDKDRPLIFNHIIERFGKRKTARVPSFGTVVEKGTIDYVVKGIAAKRYGKDRKTDWRAMRYNNKPLYDYIEEIKAAFARNEDEAREKYPDVFYYFDGVINTKVSYSVHPAGIVISPIDLITNYGVIEKDGELVLLVDMEEVHEIGLAKYDFLILKNVGIIQDAFKLANKKYPRSHEINWNDEDVWADIVKSPVGVFQFEGNYAHEMLRKYEPHNIFDMSLVTAAIRPSGASYRDNLMEHKPFKNPSPIIDELLKDNWGYLIYQEDTIKFLQQICGLSGSDADNVRRAIGRKDEARLSKALPQILEGYCNKSPQPREVAEEEAKIFLRIIEDSASYQFGYNHSIAYCLIGYMCAYLRYYYPAQFITAYLNNAANQDDIADGTALAKEKGFPIKPIKFGYSGASYRYDPETNSIYKGLQSVAFFNTEIGERFASISPNMFSSFTEVLSYIVTFTDSRQRKILIDLDFFSDFGNSRELAKILEVFEGAFSKGAAKTIHPTKLNVPNVEYERYCECIGKNGSLLKSYRIKDLSGLLNHIENIIKAVGVDDFSISYKIKAQNDYLGYCDYISGKEEDRTTLIVNGIYPVKRRADKVVFAYTICGRSVGTGKENRFTVINKLYEKLPVKSGDLIKVLAFHKNNRGFWCIDNYEQTW